MHVENLATVESIDLVPPCMSNQFEIQLYVPAMGAGIPCSADNTVGHFDLTRADTRWARKSTSQRVPRPKSCLFTLEVSPHMHCCTSTFLLVGPFQLKT